MRPDQKLQRVASSSTTFGSPEGKAVAVLWPSQSGHKQTDTEGSGFQSLALFCSTEIIWSHFGIDIIEVEALSNQYCIAAWSIEEATPGIQKMLPHFTCFFFDKFLSPSLVNFIRLKHHILASSKQIPKSGVWLEVYAHINQTFGSGIWALP